jgi:hypothetical protein
LLQNLNVLFLYLKFIDCHNIFAKLIFGRQIKFLLCNSIRMFTMAKKAAFDFLLSHFFSAFKAVLKRQQLKFH